MLGTRPGSPVGYSGSMGQLPVTREPPAALRTFLEPYDAAIVRLFLAARSAVLAAAPDASELVYDAYNAVSAAYSFTDRLKEAFCHVAAYPGHVNLGFNRGAGLADPEGLLVGTGRSIRHVRLSAIDDLGRPGVRDLLRAAVEEGRGLDPAVPLGPRTSVRGAYPRRRRPGSARP
jgi:hypothetical protein